jgi:hypothetical protein
MCTPVAAGACVQAAAGAARTPSGVASALHAASYFWNCVVSPVAAGVGVQAVAEAAHTRQVLHLHCMLPRTGYFATAEFVSCVHLLLQELVPPKALHLHADTACTTLCTQFCLAPP